MPTLRNTFFYGRDFDTSGAGIISTPYIMEDIYLKGGYRAVATYAERNEYTTNVSLYNALKVGALFYIKSDDTFWKTIIDPVDPKLPNGRDHYIFVPLVFGGGLDCDDITLTEPLYKDVAGCSLKIRHKAVLPIMTDNKWIGSLVTLDNNLDPLWVSWLSLFPPRTTLSYLCPDPLARGEYHEFSLDMKCRTILMLELTLNVPGIKLEFYYNSDYSSPNPYTFISGVGVLYDDGKTWWDPPPPEVIHNRRFTLLSNLDSVTPADPNPTWIFGRFTNLTVDPLQPGVNFLYFPLELSTFKGPLVPVFPQ